MADLFLRWIVPSIVILLAVAASGDSVESGPATSTGVKVTVRVPFVRESIDEIRALAPFRERTAPGDRAIPFLRIQRRSGATGPAGSPLAEQALAAPFFTSSPAPLAPALDSSFAGLGNPPHGEDVIPPDTMGAAGPNHLVSLLNSDFGVFNKTTGAVLPNQKISLQSFWGSLGTGAGEPADFPFDTKILYDQHSGRFVAITLGGTSAPDSWVMVAVSATSDPSGAWSKWAIDADVNHNVQTNDNVQTNNSADFPGLGVDAFNVYITANMFDGANVGQYSKVWVIPKAQLLTGANPITWFEFFPPHLPGSDFTMQPAHTFGAPGAEYFLFEGTANHLAVAWMDNTSGTPVWHSPVSVAVSAYVSTDSTPGAPQLGNANTIDTSDTRVLNAVYRNGSVWATHHVVGPSGKVEVAWYRINPGTGTVQSQGRVTDPNRWYYYPSIAVNQDNVAAIGFSGSSTTEYAGGYYTIVQPSTGTAEAVALLKAGDAPYFKVFDGNQNRWGDFSATVVDPTDDTSFWTLQEYAMTHDTFNANNNVVDRSRWGTWWGKFHPSDVLSPTGLTATADNASQVTLRWTDLATNETGYVVERKIGAGGPFGVLTSPLLPPNSVTYTDNVGLVAGTTYFYRVGAVGSTGTSYSIEVSVTIPGSPPSSGGGGGGGCLSITRTGGEMSSATSLLSVGILILPACALGIRRFFRRQERTDPIRHPIC